jgi:hypothetical protein
MRAAFVLAGLAVLLVPAAAHGAPSANGSRADAIAFGVISAHAQGATAEYTTERLDAQSAVVGPAGDIRSSDGVVLRYYAGYGYRFQPLASFARLNALVSMRSVGAARRLASALVARGVRRGNAVYWEYDFPFGGPTPWTSGFAQAVGAQALARTSVFVDDDAIARTADAAFRGLRRTLLMRLGGGLWVREYEFTNMAILNAQLQSIISIESYAKIAETAAARRVAARLYTAARALLPRFGLGCWSRYSLGGAAASTHYHAYHLELLRRLASTHATDRIWRSTYLKWKRCPRV